MKLSTQTLSILKNFGNINQGIYFRNGKKLRTISPQQNILAQAEIDEEIPSDFGIYDLNNFLSVVTLHKEEPSFEFDDKHIYVIGNNNRSKIKYRFCDPSMIVVPPEKGISVPDPKITFELTSDDFTWIMRAASVLSSPNIAVESDGSVVNIVTMNVKDDSAHTDCLKISDGDGSRYRMIYKTENLTKILPGTYTVEVSTKGVSYFKSQSMKLEYWVAVESGSNYEPSVE